MKKFSFLIVLIVLPILSDACSCWTTPVSTEKINNTDLVFKGKAISVRKVELTPDRSNKRPHFRGYDSELIEFIFEMKQNIKPSRHNKIVKIYTSAQDGLCGSNFKIGEQYYVFAYRNSRRYSTDICKGNKRAKKASKAFKRIVRQYRKGGDNIDFYDVDGFKVANGSLENGLYKGNWIYYHEDGSIKTKGNYLNGKKGGVWKNYHNKLNSKWLYDRLSKEDRLKLSDKDNIPKVWIFYEKGEASLSMPITYTQN